MSKENEPDDLSKANQPLKENASPKPEQDIPGDKYQGARASSGGQIEDAITRKDMLAYNKQSKAEQKQAENFETNKADSTISRLDLTLSVSKSTAKIGSFNAVGGIGSKISPEFPRQLGNSNTTRNQEFKYIGPNQAQARPDQFLMGNTFGLPFQQMLKSEFKEESKDWSKENLKPVIDIFLSETAPKEQKNLTVAEREQLAKHRHAIEDSHSDAEVLSNALHLSRLYQHLRYIEEAKKALALALLIDPDNILGNQLFSELERMHPADLGRAAISATNGENLLSKAQLRKRILEFSKGRIMVVGDLLIDELQEGRPVRISREAPVLILEHVVTELIPGGAANTAHNITAYNAVCHAVGICGKDDYAKKMAQVLEKCQIKHSLVEDPNRPTTVKTRILSKSHSQMQQLLRLDRISHEPTSEATSKLLVEKIKAEAKNYQAIILSDYRAGVITDDVIEACREIANSQQLMVIVDAQGGFERFRGLTLMTPNQPDTEAAVGYSIETNDDLKRAGLAIMHTTGLEALLVTRGGDGMVLFQKGKDMVELPAFNRSDVFDVTGAGDTVVATMTLALVTGASYVEAMALGNLAAGIVVRKSGTAVTNQRELMQNLEALDIPE
ncbi:MAG: bifunctional ADP-heptose synthase [Candidatus Obscuribacterales bacterium]|nr:bifunctional ADP-heptose synthase [Candidatus Obscuribacterales bacterium]